MTQTSTSGPVQVFPQSADDALGLDRFAVGQSVSRAEDPVLLRGEGRYSDDVSLPGQVHAAFVRAREAHGVIRDIRTARARAMKGVLLVITQADLDAAGFGEIRTKVPIRQPDGRTPPSRPPLARGKVRFSGEIVACVVARTLDQALDAAEAVELDIDALPAVTLASEADAPGAPQLFESVPGNVIYDYRYGDEAAVAAAFERAHHVTRLGLRNTRLVVNPLEPRSALCSYDAREKRYTLRAACQGVKGLQANIASDLLQAPASAMRVLTGQIGGSFGLKGAVFPEYACLLHACRRLRRPVKWTDRRSDSFLGDYHGRDDERLGELALDRRGRILALRISGHGNLGAYVTAVGTMASTSNVPKNAAGVYATPVMAVHSRTMVTNTVPIGPYRGAGRPEANYFMERLMDVAAAETGIDRITLRRRNHIRPSMLPFTAASGLVYDSGDFPAVLDRALEASDWKGFGKRKAASRRRGLLRGIGLGQFLEGTAA
ncbi:MAG TPA: molybdopterin-dependent oxidoreductase, partial [Beijerinckiaceae bacterium]|nr:molybdopterin-dependent oxidoreductase [Beijerinckiaceae bacterium]